MAKNKKNPKSAKGGPRIKKAQAYKSTQNTPSTRSSRDSQQKGWRYVVTIILVVFLVLALGGSLFFGIIASAYSLPLPQVQQAQSAWVKQQSHATSSLRTYDVQAGDLIDGQPAEDYVSVTDDLPSVEAPMAALCTKDGRILFERNIDQQVTMASTTKMMTAIIALENMDLATPLTVTYGAANTDGTEAELEEGMVISLIDCLYGLLLPSGNDAAVVIAENMSGMESRFVELMNAKAVELGMTATHYADASGLTEDVDEDGDGQVDEDGHYTTVRDYLTLTRYCMSNPTFRQIVSTGYYEANVNGQILNFYTTDKLGDYLTVAQPIGVKTGYTEGAGYCFVGAADLGGIELYSVVFNEETTEQRFVDTAHMLEWGFRHYRTIELINTSQQVADVALLSWIDKTVPAYAPAVVHVELFDLNGAITQDITINDINGEATKGQSCGEIIWSQGEDVLVTSDVVATETVLAPDFWEGLSIGWQRFWDGFSGAPPHAETTILLKSELAIPAAPTET